LQIAFDYNDSCNTIDHLQAPIAFAMQPNVIKKSWTTSNIAAAVDIGARKLTEEVSTTTFESRDLIREYLLKTRVPEIFKTQQNRRHSSETFTASAMTSEMNFAYKHPLVIAEELKNGSGETMADDSVRKLCNAVDNSSIIVPRRVVSQWKRSDDRPHLIGKVTPSIARTWEQLTNAMDQSMENQSQEEEKQSYVLFVRKPFNFQRDDDDFAVNKIQHDAATEKFFDSIEGGEYADDYDEESCPEGGEEMAEELDSLEMRCNDVILWSIES
jgi:chemotaxis protein histidine kinase CheA